MPMTAIDPALEASRSYTMLTQLERHALMQPDGVVIRFGGCSVTWQQLRRRTARAAGALAARGVGRGDRVAVLMTNRSEFVETVLAAGWLGAIAVPVNFRLVPSEICWILRDCAAAVIVADAPLAPVLAEVRRELPLQALVVGDPHSEAGESYESALADVASPPEMVSVSETDIALIMYTSGTTGRPKGAMLTHLNLLMQAVTIIRGWSLSNDEEITLVAMPLFHIAGIGAMAPMLLIGGTAVIVPTGGFDPDEMVTIIESEGVTSAFLVPTQWQAVCALPGVRDRAPSLRSLSWGASPAAMTTLEAMADAFPGLPNIAVFGQTEMSPVTCVLQGEDAIRKLGSVGKPVATVATRIVDDDMNDVPRGEVGEIVYRGPSLMAGYWQNPQATAEAFAGGWFHSGDLVREDDEGFLYVVDRKKDMIISGGENIYCAEVEDVLAGHPKVLEVALIGLPHDRWVETPVAVVAPRDPAEAPTLEELVEWCRTRLASYKKPTAIHLVEALPRNASGKVLKVALRDELIPR
jgi:fatty-acyl-CoA synthase